MANGYVSQVQLPNNETYNIRDKELIPRLKATVGHSNKNLLDLKNIKVKTEYGITWTINEQGGIVTATGTVQSGKKSQLEFILKDIPSGNYYFYGCIGGSGTTYDVYCWDFTTSSRPKQWDGTTNVYSDYNLVPRQLKVVDNHEIGIALRINSGVTVNNLIFKPMVWDGSILDDTFEPYQEPTDKLIETKTRAYLNSTVGHACKNLLDMNKYTTISGISDIQINEDTGSLSFTGMGTWRSISYLVNDDISLKPNGITYILTCINNLATSTAQLAIRRGDTNVVVYTTSLSTTGKKELKFTASSEKFPNGWYVSILVTGGTSSTGSADISNLMLREASIADDAFEPYQTPTNERFKDYLPLSGGTLTRELTMSGSVVAMKGTNIDLAGDNPTSLTWSNSELCFRDNNNKRAGFINIARGTDGSTRLSIDAQCRKSDNSGDYYNGINIIARRDGTKAYSVSDPAAFRTAIGAGTSSTDTKNTAGSTDTSDKIFLIGAESQAANPQTYSDNQVYVTNGSLYLTKETDADGAKDNKPALLIGNPTGTHLELDGNEVMAKSSATTTGPLYLNSDGGLVYIKNLQVGGGTESGTLTLYGYSNGAFISGELIQPFNVSGGTITHSLPLKGGDLFGSGNLVAGEGISRSESGGIYTISTESDIVLGEIDLDNNNVDNSKNYISIDEFLNDPNQKYYIEIYYTANNGKSPSVARIPLITGIVPQNPGAVGNEFVLSITGDINTTYIRTSCFKFKTPSSSYQSIRLYGQSSYIITFTNPSGTSSETKNSYTIQKKTVSDGNYTGFWVVPYKMRFIQEKSSN